MMTLPLADVVIVSVEQAVAAPLATRHLADLGARVIKVERPNVGDFARGYDSTVKGQSSYFVWLNRGQESLTLDHSFARGEGGAKYRRPAARLKRCGRQLTWRASSRAWARCPTSGSIRIES